jgi:hypothetical protein
VAFARFPIEGISGGPNGELGRPKLSRTAWQRTPDIFVFRVVVITIPISRFDNEVASP